MRRPEVWTNFNRCGKPYARMNVSGRQRTCGSSFALFDDSRQAVLVWHFRRGWPCKFTGPALKAKGNEIAIETLEICHEGLEIE